MTESGVIHEQVREREAPAPRRRGHGAKITEAVHALQSEGKLLSALRPSERDKRIEAWFKARGYSGSELPTRSSYARYFRCICIAGETGETHIAERHE